MRDELELHGVVLCSAPSRDFDKRLSVLTNECGKITVWASGAKKTGSQLMAGTRNFVFGTFSVTKGRSGYNLKSVKVNNYFEEIANDLVNACYGSYILEFADYIAQENLEATETVNLIYMSLKAILNPNLDNDLVRRIFELRLLYISGEYTEEPPIPCSQACRFAWQFVLGTPVMKLYTFTLKDEVMYEFSQNIDMLLKGVMPHNFRSLEILKTLK
ncbi:DNA repair protein RecO [Oribacterium sp. WCC10]|uniref:DNA repair protein RecO n=1 Tax=Oribacterium sp. WCC10 TaxID=1855343 RepID=UPI0008F3DDF1|nr:DNA repair protein RecO [Oribacterium sp. WCC10]SFG38696.1 DNA replication and repair protein RecO [Oribacterium sp. WCC10]